MITALSSVSLAEAGLGISLKNTHVLRDFFNVLLLSASLFFSMRSLQLYHNNVEKGRTTAAFNYGYLRFCLLACLINCVYLVFATSFDWMENYHYLMESWEKRSHETLSLSKFNAPMASTQMVNTELKAAVPVHTHQHQSTVSGNFSSPEELEAALDTLHKSHNDETRHIVSIFAFIRLAMMSAYLYLDLKDSPLLYEYMLDTWLGWPASFNQDKKKVKQKVIHNQRWNGALLCVYSVQIVMINHAAKCLGTICSNMIRIDLGLLGFVLHWNFVVAVLAPCWPILFETFQILMLAVTPHWLHLVVKDKLNKLSSSFEQSGVDVRILDFKIICLDKSFNIANVRIEVPVGTDAGTCSGYIN